MEKVNFNKGVKIIISPTENGYACGLINEIVDMKDEGIYLCHIIAQGMIKFAMAHPQETFDFGVEQVNNDDLTKTNGELKQLQDYDNVIDIRDLLKKRKKDLH